MTARLLAVLFALCFASAAQAQVQGSTPASGCVPDETTVKFDRHKVGNASVQHATGNVDLIVLTCPISRFSSSTTVWVLGLTYQDSTGTNAQAFVRARLYRMGLAAANPVLLATVSSNSSGATALNTILSQDFAHTFDFNASIYWVHVELDRETTGQTVIFHSTFLNLAP